MKDIQRPYMMLLDVLILLQESESIVIFLNLQYFMNKKLYVSTTLSQFSKFPSMFRSSKIKVFHSIHFICLSKLYIQAYK